MFQMLAQQSNNADPAAAAGALGFLCCFFGVLMLPAIIVIVSWWKIFEKAGKPGWASIIPIYNLIIITEIVGRPIWWAFLPLIPVVGIVFILILFIDLAKSFGKDTLYGVLLFFLGIIFFPILAFSDAKYVGPSAPAQ